MEYTTLGRTGMQVSRIGLGGSPLGLDSSDRWDWTVGEAESRAIIERAIDLGITFFDTANSYSWGDSERILGKTIRGYDRDRLVIATKVNNPPSPDPHPNSTGLSRKTIDQELQHSLDRLGLDTIDLYQIHRWDYDTPIDETLRALSDTIRRGAVRYIGASSMWAHQFGESLYTADTIGLDRFSTMQNHYNLVYREEEREMLPLCAKNDIGVITWSPLARGYLARPHADIRSTDRGETDDYLHNRPYDANGGREINERVQEVAADHGVSMAQIGLAWLLHKEWVDVPIVGTTTVDHIEDAVEALEIDLSVSELEYLEEPYRPKPIMGHD